MHVHLARRLADGLIRRHMHRKVAAADDWAVVPYRYYQAYSKIQKLHVCDIWYVYNIRVCHILHVRHVCVYTYTCKIYSICIVYTYEGVCTFISCVYIHVSKGGVESANNICYAQYCVRFPSFTSSETRNVARDSHSTFWNSDYRQRFPLKSTEIWRYRKHTILYIEVILSPLHSTRETAVAVFLWSLVIFTQFGFSVLIFFFLLIFNLRSMVVSGDPFRWLFHPIWSDLSQLPPYFPRSKLDWSNTRRHQWLRKSSYLKLVKILLL